MGWAVACLVAMYTFERVVISGPGLILLKRLRRHRPRKLFKKLEAMSLLTGAETEPMGRELVDMSHHPQDGGELAIDAKV